MLDLEPIRARLEAARTEISALCHGKRWQMTIPARPDDDSDLIIGAALRDMYELLREIERLRTALDTIGTTIYTQGRGTKVEQQLLTFIREQLGRI